MSDNASHPVDASGGARRRGRLGWLGIGLPWIAGLATLAVFSVLAYLDGLRFVVGMHVFGWFADLAVLVVVYAAGVFVAVVVVAMRRGNAWRRPALVIVSSLIVPCAALPTMSRCFFAGRDAAYRSLDCEVIYAACQALRRQVGDSDAFTVQPQDDAYDQLPPAIRRLSPLEVHVSRHAVIIQMDGGGVMYREGIGVAMPEADDAAVQRLAKHPRLHPSRPVFLYRVDDNSLLTQSTVD